MSGGAPWDYIAKLVCIGDSGTGKSSLTIRLCEGRFTPHHDVTIGVEFGSRVVPVGPPASKELEISNPNAPPSLAAAKETTPDSFLTVTDPVHHTQPPTTTTPLATSKPNASLKPPTPTTPNGTAGSISNPPSATPTTTTITETTAAAAAAARSSKDGSYFNGNRPENGKSRTDQPPRRQQHQQQQQQQQRESPPRQKLMKLSLWDTAGQETYKSITRSYFRGASGALLVYDITRPSTFESATSWLQDLRQIAEENIVVVLVGNKSDLAGSDDGDNNNNNNDRDGNNTRGGRGRKVSREQAQEWCRRNNVLGFCETSAKSGEGVERAFREVAERVWWNVEAGLYDLQDRRSGVKGYGGSRPGRGGGGPGGGRSGSGDGGGEVVLGIGDMKSRGGGGGCC